MSNETKNKIVPKLRFAEFKDSGEWEEKTMEEVAPLQRGFDLPADQIKPGPIPIVYSNWVRNFHNVGMVKGPGIVTVRSGTIGEIHFIADGDYWPHNTSLWVTSFKSNSPKFIYYLYKSIGLKNRFASGSGVPTLNRNDVHAFHVYIPSSLEEQQKIADCLSSLGELITAQSQKLQALKSHKKGLMQQLFPVEGETVPKLRFTEFRNGEEWRTKTLKNVCRMQAGKFVSASDISENKNDDLFPCYGGNGLRGYTSSYTHSGKYSLIGRQGALCGNITLADGKFHATEHAVVVTPESGVDTVWLFYMLNHLNLNHYATGQAQPGLSVENLEKIDIQIPELEKEQQKIADCLSSLDEQISAQAEKIDALKAHKKG